MREIKFRAWDGERLRNVWSIGWTEDELDYIGTPKYNGPAEHFELMQYTGIEDKKGVSIYEGDIVSDGVLTGDVQFHEGAYYFGKYRTLDSLISEICDLEIIGNIYEHPELLEGDSH